MIDTITDQEYLKKGVDLANGWSWECSEMNVMIDGFCLFAAPRFYLDQPLKDALSVQLVRQVHALENKHIIDFNPKYTAIKIGLKWITAKGPDHAMNTIKAIINSNVLK